MLVAARCVGPWAAVAGRRLLAYACLLRVASHTQPHPHSMCLSARGPRNSACKRQGEQKGRGERRGHPFSGLRKHHTLGEISGSQGIVFLTVVCDSCPPHTLPLTILTMQPQGNSNRQVCTQVKSQRWNAIACQPLQLVLSSFADPCAILMLLLLVSTLLKFFV